MVRMRPNRSKDSERGNADQERREENPELEEDLQNAINELRVECGDEGVDEALGAEPPGRRVAGVEGLSPAEGRSPSGGVHHVEHLHRFSLPTSAPDIQPLVNILPGPMLPGPGPLPPGFNVHPLSPTSAPSAPSLSTSGLERFPPKFTLRGAVGGTASASGAIGGAVGGSGTMGGSGDVKAKVRAPQPQQPASDRLNPLSAGVSRSSQWSNRAAPSIAPQQQFVNPASNSFPPNDLSDSATPRNSSAQLPAFAEAANNSSSRSGPAIPSQPPAAAAVAVADQPQAQNQQQPSQNQLVSNAQQPQQLPPQNQQALHLSLHHHQQHGAGARGENQDAAGAAAARVNPFDLHNELEVGVGHVLKDRMASLCANEILADVHFVVGTPEGAVAAGGVAAPPIAGMRTIPAHKCVLVTASSVFYAMFCGGLASRSKDGDEIMVPDVDPEAFMAMLRYIYSEEINLEPESVLPTLYAAKKYMVNPLANECINYLEKNLKPENVCVILMQSKLYDEEELAEKCLRDIDLHTEEVLNSEGFLEVDHLTLQSLVSRDALSIPEIKLFEASVRWAAAECLRRGLEPTPDQKRKMLGPVLHMIRVPTISLADFSNRVSKSGLLTAEECVKMFQYFTADDKPGNLEFICEPRRKVGTERRCRRFPYFLHVSSTFYGLHSIAFKASRKVAIVGFGLYGWAQGCACHVVTAQLMYQGNVIAETHQRITAHCPEDEPTYRVKFDNPVEINADVLYSACVILNGAQSYYGMDGKDRCEADTVTFTFLNSMDGSNGTNVEHGQIPEIIFTEPH